MRMVLRSALLLSIGVLAACPSRDVSRVDPNQSKEQQKEIPISLNRNIDILFLVDDSGSMAQEQQALAQNFVKFIDVLKSIEGGLPNVHIGVISSNVGTAPVGNDPKCEGQGDNGVMQVPDACPDLTDGKNFIIDVATSEDDPSQRDFNYTGNLEDQFSCMAQLGIGGCGFEQHFESMKRALDDNPANAGFLREDAFLAVIILADEDDCSAYDREVYDPSDDDVDSTLGELSSFRCFEFGTTCEGVPEGNERDVGDRQNCTSDDNSDYIEKVSTYVDFLKGLKSDPSKVIVAGIIGPDGPVAVGLDPEKDDERWVEPSCFVCPGVGPAQLGDCPFAASQAGAALVAAAPSIRMTQFLNAFPQRSTFQSICTYDEATDSVDLSGALTQIALLLKKVVGNPCIEGNLSDPPECRVSDVRNLNTDFQEEFIIPACDVADPPCFDLVPSDDCNTESGLSLVIDRGSTEPPSDTTVVARCLVE